MGLTGDGGGGAAAGGSEVTVNWPGFPPRAHQALTAAPFHSRYSLNATRPKRQAAALLHLAQHAEAPR